MTRLLVLGGNGFVGRAVCKQAIQRGWNVTSLSRSGAPSSLPAALQPVNWAKGSATDSPTIAKLASGQDYIVNCVGTLFEAPPSRTYEGMNYKPMASTVEALNTGIPVKAVAFVSAATFDPLTKSLLSRYYETKGKGEKALFSWAESAAAGRAAVFRPGLIYGWDRPATVFASFFFRLLTLFSASIFPPPIQVDHLASTILDNISRDGKKMLIVERKDM